MAKSVLIVEDNEHLRNIYASILRFSGYEIVEAESGTEAIEKAASAQPRLILLDLNLPDMPGIDVARSIKRHQRSAHIPIIGCSAFSIGEERENSLAAGMVDYLRKPFPSQVLKAKIEEFILPQKMGDPPPVKLKLLSERLSQDAQHLTEIPNLLLLALTAFYEIIKGRFSDEHGSPVIGTAYIKSWFYSLIQLARQLTKLTTH